MNVHCFQFFEITNISLAINTYVQLLVEISFHFSMLCNWQYTYSFRKNQYNSFRDTQGKVFQHIYITLHLHNGFWGLQVPNMLISIFQFMWSIISLCFDLHFPTADFCWTFIYIQIKLLHIFRENCSNSLQNFELLSFYCWIVNFCIYSVYFIFIKYIFLGLFILMMVLLAKFRLWSLWFLSFSFIAWSFNALCLKY